MIFTISRFRATRPLAVAAAATLGLVTMACNNGSSSSSLTPTTSPTLITDILTGTVNAPVNGVLQSDAKTFTVAQGGGQVSITLTSAVETLPGGTLLTTVSMGLAVGTSDGTTCTILTNGSTIAQAGSVAQLSGTVANGGTYCVQVSDVSNQLGPVSYAVAVVHP